MGDASRPTPASLLAIASREFLEAAKADAEDAAPKLPDLSRQSASAVSLDKFVHNFEAISRLAATKGAGLSEAQRDRVRSTQPILDALMQRMEDSSDALQMCIETYGPEGDGAGAAAESAAADGNGGGGDARERVQRVLRYAHRLSYSTFAPPGFVPGATPLGPYKPPAPQEWQMRCTLLHEYAAKHAARFAAMADGQRATPAAGAPQTAAAGEAPDAAAAAVTSAAALPPLMMMGEDPAAAMAAALAAMGIQLPPNFRPPPPPPGWRPGDQIQFPPELLTQLMQMQQQGGFGGVLPAAAAAAEQPKQAEAVPPVAEQVANPPAIAAAAAPAAAPGPGGHDFGLVLNPELHVELASESDDDSNEYEDDDDFSDL